MQFDNFRKTIGENNENKPLNANNISGVMSVVHMKVV